MFIGIYLYVIVKKCFLRLSGIGYVRCTEEQSPIAWNISYGYTNSSVVSFLSGKILSSE